MPYLLKFVYFGICWNIRKKQPFKILSQATFMLKMTLAELSIPIIKHDPLYHGNMQTKKNVSQACVFDKISPKDVDLT